MRTCRMLTSRAMSSRSSRSWMSGKARSCPARVSPSSAAGTRPLCSNPYVPGRSPQFNGEVIDAKITNVNKMGFFAEVGPLSIFVSSHLLPIDYKFQPDANPPEFTSPTDVRAPALTAEPRKRTTRACAHRRYACGRQRNRTCPPLTHAVRHRHHEGRLPGPL